MHAEPHLEAHIAEPQLPARNWALPGLLLLGTWIAAWHSGTASTMVAKWIDSETFTHGFLVVPIVLYLVWCKRDRLAELSPRPFPPALALLALAGFAWLLGELASVIVVSQIAMVAMLPLAVWAVFGTEFVLALSFPLAFLFFAVPFGEFLVPWLMDRTADFTVAALRASGVPVFREGNKFVIPSGAWSVVEACGGLRYLIASMVVGFLYAYLTYRSLRRRLVFIGLSILVPLVANWLRAYMIVMLGHLSGNRIAVGIDHLIYGWIFFGVVMVLLFWAGSFWRQDIVPAAAGPGPVHSGGPRKPWPKSLLFAVPAVLIVTAMWRPVAWALTDPTHATQPQLAQVIGTSGWGESSGRLATLKPHYLHASTELMQAFSKSGMTVGVYIGYYRNQTQGSELVRSGNQLVASSDPDWAQASSRYVSVARGEEIFRAHSAELHGKYTNLVAWQWYWVDGKFTASRYAAKAYLALAKLLGHGDDSAVVVVYAPKDPLKDTSGKALEEFVKDMSPGIVRALEQARGG